MSGLSMDEVDRLIVEGDRFKLADELRKELAELRNQAETLLYTTEAALEGYANLVDGETLEATRAQAAELRDMLEKQADLGSIREAYQRLEGLTFAIAEKMYGNDGGEQPAT
jgi:molecular chaperone DnaK